MATSSEKQCNLVLSPLLVSTTTVIGSVGRSVNILDVAKYLPLDEVVIGLKLVYARGSSTIIRGVAKFPKARKQKTRDGFFKDFYNQVTCTLRIPTANPLSKGQKVALVSCKVFHNGTLHLTGSRSRTEAALAANLLLAKLATFSGVKLVSVVKQIPYLKSHDNIIYATDGSAVGWSITSTRGTEMTHIQTDYVSTVPVENVTGLVALIHDNTSDAELRRDTCRGSVFVSEKWQDDDKHVYTLNGTLLGTLQLCFDPEASKRHFEVVFGYIYSGDKIIGKESFIPALKGSEEIIQTLMSERLERSYLLEHGVVIHAYTALAGNGTNPWVDLPEETFTTHMINTFFQAPFRIDRERLHACFLANGLYSRLEPCDNSAVNLRYHHNVNTELDPRHRGKCFEKNKQACACKDISVSCFGSGKMNVAGLGTMQQGVMVYEFMREFFFKFRSEIEATVY